ncbi:MULTISPECIES: sensor histidine kinase [Nostoc]|uniref:histidine kinase n=2 Tax=Nostoc TaxID=1177 RepID=A0ABR8I2X6_9NOSO|nr:MULTISPECIES: PAS domain-containing sensor histidine kinase [Nostoc]MBD2559875.1 PAS domain-containing sensor histidine kinase [Nostoc linckia FACHB-391]MBD2645161.1 PAS domain-containing sensor histidine kinase [Nostoc foliaceum FACHB-393]
MHIEEPATHKSEALLSVQDSQSFPESQPLQKGQKDLSQEDLDPCQCSQAALQMALLASGLGLWDWNLVTDKTYYDPQWKRILGYEEDEIDNDYTSFERLVHPGDLARIRQTLHDYLQGCTPVFEVELRMLTKSGEWKWILACGKVFQWDEFGKPVRMAGTHKDISQDKAMSTTGCAYAIQQYRLFEQLQTEITQRQSTEDQVKEKSQQLEITLEELKYTQRQLLQNQKMANLGQLVADMANEINNPVSFIYGNLHPASQYAEDLIRIIELYQHYYPKPAPVIALHLQRLDLGFVKTDFFKLLWSMRAGSERVKEIVFALRNFSTSDEGQMKKVDLHKGLDSVLRILQHRLKEQPDRSGIEVIKDYGELPLIECYPGDLNQVFMNILTNAIDALEERMKHDYSFAPRIFIQTEIISSHLSLVNSNEPWINDKRTGKKHKVIIRISDNGKGILPHIQRQIFEPFFTTKPVGKGKGLGLSISREIIVEKHQGKLKCNSQLGQGTELVIEMNTTARHYTAMRKHASF